jgi:hypothetical protein
MFRQEVFFNDHRLQREKTRRSCFHFPDHDRRAVVGAELRLKRAEKKFETNKGG